MKLRRAVPLLLLLIAGLSLLGGCRSGRSRERPPFRKVTPPVAFEILRDNPDILVLDLRTRQEFLGGTGHISRARNMPLERLPERLVEIGPFRDDTFLVYCRRGDTCGEQGMAVLLSSGFEDAILIEGGIDGWIRYGFKTALPAAAPAVQAGGDPQGSSEAPPEAPAEAPGDLRPPRGSSRNGP